MVIPIGEARVTRVLCGTLKGATLGEVEGPQVKATEVMDKEGVVGNMTEEVGGQEDLD